MKISPRNYFFCRLAHIIMRLIDRWMTRQQIIHSLINFFLSFVVRNSFFFQFFTLSRINCCRTCSWWVLLIFKAEFSIEKHITQRKNEGKETHEWYSRWVTCQTVTDLTRIHNSFLLFLPCWQGSKKIVII